VSAGAPRPLGASFDGEGVNFALFSAHAERMELCLFAPGAAREHARLALPGRSGDVWHGRVEGLRPGQHYGYRVHGPWQPAAGHRFNPHKLLLDPYAREHSGPVRWSGASYAFRAGDAHGEASFDVRDSAPFTPRGVVAGGDDFDWQGVTAPRTPWADTVIYELNVGGFTRLHPHLSAPARGTFEGLAHPRVIEHLLRLGVTAVELMPVHAFVDDPFLVARGLRNFWGYSTIGFFAPETRYLAGEGREAFQRTVRALHRAGIEVILDVVYNHTAEGNHLGPTLSFRGIDNASYYRLAPGNPARYQDHTGCGNTLQLGHPQVRELVLDSLRYWAGEMHVDGFRFDLATALARERDGFEPDGAFFRAIASDPLLGACKLIAEPWDLGPDGYRLGGFPPGWAEWNDRYRDTVRSFWLEPANLLPELARRLHGSGDLFDHPGRGPWASVNFAASHDGFTLRDLVSYRHRHNEANGEGNRDGHAENHSCNHGVEGETDDPRILALRARQVRNLLATVLLSRGTPMLLAGDELGRTQRGNNNAYCQDNAIGWLDWSLLEADPSLAAFTARLVALRAAHPVLRLEEFVHGAQRGPASGLPDIAWLRPDGAAMTEADWHAPGARCLGVLGCAAVPGSPAGEDLLLIVLNAATDAVDFNLPAGERFARAFRGWRCALATGPEPEPSAGRAAIPEHSVCVFEPVVRG